MSRRLSDQERRILFYIDQAGGSYCPDDTISPDAADALRDLVKAKCLSVETDDGALPRYHLTAKGRADAA